MMPKRCNEAPVAGTLLAPPREPPSTGVVDLLRLCGAVVAEGARHPLDFSLDAAFRSWATRACARLQSENLVVNLGVKKLLLVGSGELSSQILSQLPRSEGISTGSLKRSAMAFLAPRALTISDDGDWVRRRVFNEAVLQPERPHEFAQDFVRATLAAFAAPIASVADLRTAMGRAMLEVVFGGNAAPRLAQEIQTLFGLVQNPLRRALTAPWAYRRRARFYDSLRALWADGDVSVNPSLLPIARRNAAGLEGAELLEQIPHWMFTFTGSATDLMTRALVLISCAPAVRARVLAEVQAAGPLGDAGHFAAMRLLEGCLLEAAQLYPPVTRTFRRALDAITVGDVSIPPGIEIMQLFPPLMSAAAGAAQARSFNPDRWLQADPPVVSFDPFLGGPRRCPGRNLILLICQVALASLLVQQRLVVDAPGMGPRSLPAVFPRRGLRFHAAGGTAGPPK